MRTTALVLLIPCVLALGTACVDADAPVDPARPEPFVLEVPPGATASGLTETLEAEGLVPAGWQWRWFLRGTEAGCLKAGKHRVTRAGSMRELLETLCGAPLVEDEPFTVVEGWRIRDIDAALAAKGWIAPGAYAAAARPDALTIPFAVEAETLEGYLFPETYRVVPERFDVTEFVARQVATLQERFVAKHPDGFGERSLHDIVVMASMLEREEPKPAQRPVVAGILWKRLDAGWNLGVDATSRYTLDDWSDRRAFLGRLRDPEDVYNTRLRGGLPPTAIGNPGLESLEAAAAPEDSPYWYYLHDGDGTFHGARDAAGHAANRARHNVY